MTLYAQTDIKHGDPNGSVLYFNEGDEVSGLPDDAVDNLKEVGALADTPPLRTPDQVTDFTAGQSAEIERLKTLLEQHNIDPNDEPEPVDEPEQDEPVNPDDEPDDESVAPK